MLMRAIKDAAPAERFICHGGRNDVINQNRQEYVLLSSKWQSLRDVIALSMETPTKARPARFIFTWAVVRNQEYVSPTLKVSGHMLVRELGTNT